MAFDFTSWIDRSGRDAIAADVRELCGCSLTEDFIRPGFDRIPMWVADMCFATAPSVVGRVTERLAHPIFGYFAPSDEYYDAISRWQRESFGTEGLGREQIGYENGVLGGVTSALRILCAQGEPILVHSPTYNGFTAQLERNGFPAILSPLRADEKGVPRMDFADMEEKLVRHRIHTALFCSPHNPSGRVWERWELEQAMELFRKYEVSVISDEIWADLTLFGHRHIPTQSVSEDARQRTLAFYAPSKTFNLAGLVGSYHVVYDRRLKDRLERYEALGHYNSMSVLSMHALIGAYQPEGRAWMEELKRVLEKNVETACAFFGGVEGVTLFRPQGTYVIAPDFSGWCERTGRSMDELLSAGCRVGVLWQDGRVYHMPHGIRMNLALPTHKLREALERLDKYVL